MVTKAVYCPNRGDLVLFGKRPALCLSVKEYNERTGLALFCPCTSVVKGYPYEVQIEGTDEIHGVILADQIKSFDWKTRNISFIAAVSETLLQEVLAKLNTLLE
jgi:mRNA interferase MazF